MKDDIKREKRGIKQWQLAAWPTSPAIKGFPIQQPWNRFLRKWKWGFATLLLLYILVLMPTPYTVLTPGSAEPVKHMVTVYARDDTGKGAFMLTTVHQMYANLLLLLWKSFDPHAEFGKKRDVLRGRSEQEFITGQLFNMSDSQLYAVQAAFNQLNIPYELKSNGIYVIYHYPHITNHVENNGFQTNDRIVEVDGKRVNDFESLQSVLKGRVAGEIVQVKVDRSKKKTMVKAKLFEWVDPNNQAVKRIDFGLGYGERKEVIPQNKDKMVTFKRNEIGGPSAGLMFTLELIDQLTSGDLTRGYRIAGTGIINPAGHVGIIGGVKFKVVAAVREKAALFLVPEGNYAEARAKLDTMDTNMKLVSVYTVQDALQAIEQFNREHQTFTMGNGGISIDRETRTTASANDV